VGFAGVYLPSQAGWRQAVCGRHKTLLPLCDCLRSLRNPASTACTHVQSQLHQRRPVKGKKDEFNGASRRLGANSPP